MDLRVADNPAEQRFEVFADDELAGAAYYRMQGEALAFTHTEVDDAYEGEGVGSKLAAEALGEVKERGLDVLPYCEFIRGYIKRHEEYLELVPEGERARFGLDAKSGAG
jgi:predicted GNAT family acetyltransferase